MRYRISRGFTVRYVKDRNRRYDDAAADHARAELSKFVRDAGSQDEAAKKLHIDQGTISRALKLENQPSLKVIMALAARTRRTVDDILGLTKAPAPDYRMTDSDVSRIAEEAIERVLRKYPSEPPPPSRKRRPSEPDADPPPDAKKPPPRRGTE